MPSLTGREPEKNAAGASSSSSSSGSNKVVADLEKQEQEFNAAKEKWAKEDNSFEAFL